MSKRPLVLLHGYSDRGESFDSWREQLSAGGWDVHEILAASYVSKTNEVTIADIGEAFDRALRTRPTFDDGQEFDAIVHSTGMLVLREWMAREPGRRARVKHIVGLAPATWGSPLAHKGRSLLGAVFKGEHEWGPDFMEAGNQILTGLELASAYTSALAQRDLLGTEATYGQTSETPWPFIFVGTSGYSGLRRLANEPGTDGTVRWAGVGFNSRKLSIDLTRGDKDRMVVEDWHNVDVPLVFVPGKNHGTILKDPPQELVAMVQQALSVQSISEYESWSQTHGWRPDLGADMTNGELWQQFVIRALDERGDPVPDWYLELCTIDDSGEYRRLDEFDLDVHAFSSDTSYRCFHVDLGKLKKLGDRFGIRLAAISGTDYVAYHGVGSENVTVEGNLAQESQDESRKWDAVYALGGVFGPSADRRVHLLFPFTTTLIELKFNREPMPPQGENNVLWFLPRSPAPGP